MMRWTVIFLVFANIGYFAWGAWQESRDGYWLPGESGLYEGVYGETLVLLSETEDSDSLPWSSDAVPGVQGSLNPGAQYGTTAQECLIVGPFANAVEVDELQQRLYALGIDSQERAEASNQQQDYWVHIPPLPSRDAAIRLLRELQAQRIDSFVITQGELANGISLGLFSRSESAKVVSRRLTNAGYGVAIKSLPRTPEQWWLELDVAVAGKLSTAFWDETVDQFPGMKQLQAPCKKKVM